jgi:hypothetical protein
LSNGCAPKKRRNTLSAHMQDRHKRAVKMLGYALVLDNPNAWASAADIWSVRLDPAERYSLAVAALMSLEAQDAEEVVAEVFEGAGYPLPQFLDEPLDDAQWWADGANPAELRAYCLAAFTAMPRRDQADFLAFVSKEAAA